MELHKKYKYLGIDISSVKECFKDSLGIVDSDISKVLGLRNVKLREIINENPKEFVEGVDFIDIRKIDSDNFYKIGLNITARSFAMSKHIFILSAEACQKAFMKIKGDKDYKTLKIIVNNIYEESELIV